MLPLAAAAALALAAAALPGALAGGDTVTVTLTSDLLSPPIDGAFASFSLEVNEALQYLGTPAAPNLPFAALCNALRSASGSERGPSIRIGGGSADASLWWEQPGPLPPNQTYAITPLDIAAYAAALPRFNGRVVLDTNFFLQDNATWGAAHVAALARLWPAGFSAGWIEGVEIGNEVDAYHDSGFRPHEWGERDYEAEFGAHAAALEAAGLPYGLVQGATYCCDNPDYTSTFANFTARFAPLLASVSWHHYSLHGCSGGSSQPVSIYDLLADAASAGAAAFLAPLAAAAAAAGVAFRVGEGNSVSCGGRANVSDVFAAALYSLDVQLESAAAGVRQWNWHGGPGAAYAPVSFARPPAPPGAPDVRPLYYGMWAFAAATARRARIARAGVAASNPLIKGWALQQSPVEWTLVAIHKDPNATQGASVRVAPPAGEAVAGAGGQLARLAAPSALSRYGVSFAGQTFDGSSDGAPVGQRVTEAVPVQAGGALEFFLPPASAALLTFTTTAAAAADAAGASGRPGQ